MCGETLGTGAGTGVAGMCAIATEASGHFPAASEMSSVGGWMGVTECRTGLED